MTFRGSREVRGENHKAKMNSGTCSIPIFGLGFYLMVSKKTFY